MVSTEQPDPACEEVLVNNPGLVGFIDPLESVRQPLKRVQRHRVIWSQRSIPNIQNVSTQLAGFRKPVELEEGTCKVRRRRHAIFCLAAARFFVATYSIFEEPKRLRKISKASKSATEPIHGQQRQLVIRTQLVGPTSDNVFEERQGFSMPTKSV